jgi:tryptophan halogenase
MNKNIVVVGGGSAGWLTALAAQKSYPKLNITVIESQEIGILGAGEGSTPYLTAFLEHLNIPISDIIRNCDATVKNGIKFTNWNNDGAFYYHGFSPKDSALGTESLSSRFLSTSPILVSHIATNNNLKEIDFSEKISESNKAPFIFKTKKEKDPILNYDQISNISIHFNATKLANRLKEIGIDRGINVIDGTINSIALDEKENIKSFILENNQKIECDFVFDCSGFHRLVIGKTLNSKWKSYKDFLPGDSALPFFIDMTEKIPPYTEAIAMKYGWIWKIPLQNRFGCGYVYDSSLISEDEAIKEIEDFLGYEPTYPRKDKGGFKFSAGCYEEPWTNNCIAVGLAANFVEPLEATSIWVSIVELTQIFGSPDWILNNSVETRNAFNKSIMFMNNDIVDFIYFHYMSLRKDTEFWKKFSYDAAPPSLKEKLDLWKNRLPNFQDGGDHWSQGSWFLVGAAQETINKSLAKGYVEASDDYKKGVDMYDYFVNYQNYKVSECIDHREFLEGLK